MSISEENRNELIELENKVALLMDEMDVYRSSTVDGVERRTTLVKMQMELGKHARRLKYLRTLV
jgi:hypothetical protein